MHLPASLLKKNFALDFGIRFYCDFGAKYRKPGSPSLQMPKMAKKGQKIAKMAKKRQKYQISLNFVLLFCTETTTYFISVLWFPPNKHKQFTIIIWKIILSGPNNCCLNSSQDPFEPEAWISWLEMIRWLSVLDAWSNTTHNDLLP